MRKKIYLFCAILLVTSLTLSAQRRSTRGRTTAKTTTKTDTYTEIKSLIKAYRFEDALTRIEKEETTAQKRRRAVDERLTALRNEAENGLQTLRGTEKVIFIDSFVVDKDKLLETIKIHPENGIIGPYSSFFETSESEGQKGLSDMAYRTGLGDKIYFSQPDSNQTEQLYTCSQLVGGQWEKPVLLPGLDEDEASKINPFVLSDGTTLYYAAESEEGLGGYDIFVTRYSSGNGAYLKPENIGMPFNSPANEYLYIIDEINKLGWLATDRNQPSGKVCIYVFIPNEVRTTFTYEEDGDNTEIRNAARIASISSTWYDNEAVANAKERLEAALTYQEKKTVTNAFRFVVDDTHIYTKPEHFKSKNARQKCLEWKEMTERMNLLETTLDKLRADYVRQSENQRKTMSAGMLKMEREYEELYAKIRATEKEIRNLEYNFLQNQK